MWEEVLFAVAGLAALWCIYRTIKRTPQAFSSKNMHRSLFTLGLLALGLIAFITIAVLMLKGY